MNEFSVQYLPQGVIEKMESGLLKVVGTEVGSPTLVFGENNTVGGEIPTIWAEKSFNTSKGTNLLKAIFNKKRKYESKLQQKDGRSETQPGGIFLSQIGL